MNIKAFIVGGGGNPTFCCVPDYPGGPGCGEGYDMGGGGYHSVFNKTLEKNKKYSITVGLKGQATVAFGKTANPGGNGKVTQFNCSSAYYGDGGKACDEFEAKGSTYSGYGSSAENTGRPASSGIVIIKAN